MHLPLFLGRVATGCEAWRVKFVTGADMGKGLACATAILGSRCGKAWLISYIARVAGGLGLVSSTTPPGLALGKAGLGLGCLIDFLEADMGKAKLFLQFHCFSNV